tara:strand:- start:580 stop:966 length:387 start_codon:yes stop_codon:yes gene_type:complete
MSTVKAANLQNTGSGAPAFQNSSGTEIGQLCKAWVKYNGTGTVSIYDDFNVSSITDNGTGRYTVNITNAMANTNYAVAVSGSNESESDPPSFFGCAVESYGTSAFNMFTRQGSTNADMNPICALVLGD